MANILCRSLDLSCFKTLECFEDCKLPQCYFFHSAKDRRRPKFNAYAPSLCPGPCSDPSCALAHNPLEAKYHPLFYKKRLCKDLLLRSSCLFSAFCSSAHSEAELRVAPLHLLPIDLSFLFFRLKSVFCPFSWEKHNTLSCVYAHNWQDFKRPFFAGQLPENCPDWVRDKIVLEYSDGCPRGFACRHCHGWKELDYHPARYKASACLNCPKARPTGVVPLSGSRQNPIANLMAVIVHICPFRHRWEEPRGRCEFKFFIAAQPALRLGRQSTDDFLQEVGAFPGRKANLSSEAPREGRFADRDGPAPLGQGDPDLLVDIICFERDLRLHIEQPEEVIRFRTQHLSSPKTVEPRLNPASKQKPPSHPFEGKKRPKTLRQQRGNKLKEPDNESSGSAASQDAVCSNKQTLDSNDIFE